MPISESDAAGVDPTRDGLPAWVVAGFEEYNAAGARGLVLIGREIARLVLAPVVELAGQEQPGTVDDWAVSRMKGAASGLAAALAMVPRQLSPASRDQAVRGTRLAIPLFGLYARLVRCSLSGQPATPAVIGLIARDLHAGIVAAQGEEAGAQQRLDDVRHRLVAATGRLRPWIDGPHTHAELTGLREFGTIPLPDFIERSQLLLQQEHVRARYMTRFVLPLGENHASPDHTPEQWGVQLDARADPRSTLGLGHSATLDDALEVFARRAGALWPALLGTDLDGESDSRAAWLAFTDALEQVALESDGPLEPAAASSGGGANPGSVSADGLAGTRLGGYDIEAEVGRGGMGVVYRAGDRLLSRTVALKVLSPTMFSHQDARRTFERELRSAVAIEHPFVVPIHAAGEDRGLFYIVMRFVEGVDLAGLTTKGGPLPVARALTFFGQLASALDATHRRGIAHCDIKPRNILIAAPNTAQEHALLSDFGIAQALEATTGAATSQSVVGTPTYMAPEVARGGRPTPASDQYSLACLFFAMLTGRPPYGGATAADVMRAHLAAPVPDLTTVCPNASPALAHAVSRGLAKGPGKRFPTVRAFAEAAEGADRWLDSPDAITRPIHLTATQAVPSPPPLTPTRRR